MSLADKLKPQSPPMAAPSRRPRGSSSGKVERARKYVAKMDPAISGQNGHGATWAVARKCAADFELNVEETLEVLREFNARCSPPWSESELRHKARDAFNKARVANPVEDRHWEMPAAHFAKERPASPKGQEAEPAMPDGDWEPDDRDAPDAPPFQTSGMNDAPPPPLEEPTATEPLRGLKALAAVAVLGRAALLARAAEPVTYVWNEVAVAGTVVTCAGPSGCGKTTCAFMIMAARATTGEPIRFLGRVITPAPVGQYLVLIEGEHSEGSAARVLVRSMALLGVDDSALDRIILIARKAVKLRSPEWCDVQRMIGAGLVSDVLVDTIARIAPADANSETEQVAIFDEVAKAIEMAPDGGLPKPTFWLVAHTRKNGTTGDMNDVSGSGQRVAQSDTVLMFKAEKIDGQVSETTVLFDKLREPPEDHPKPVSFSIIREADGTRRLATNLAPGKAESDSRPAEVRILEFLEKHTEPKTKEEIRKALNLSGTKVEDGITNLFGSRSIRKRSVARKTGEYPGFYAASQTPKPEEY